jgi:hypothetical protein
LATGAETLEAEVAAAGPVTGLLIGCGGGAGDGAGVVGTAAAA